MMGDSAAYYEGDRSEKMHRYHQKDDGGSSHGNSSHTRNGYSEQREEKKHRKYERDRYDKNYSNQQYTEKNQIYGQQRNQTRHQESQQHYKVKASIDRSRNPNRHQDQYPEDRSTSRSQKENSHSRSRDQYREERPSHRYQPEAIMQGNKDRNKSNEGRAQSRVHKEMNPSLQNENILYTVDHFVDNKGYEYHYKGESFQPNDVEDYVPESDGGILDCHKCRYLCTGRACCQLVEILLNMLILICCSVSYNSTGGFTGISNLGGIYYYQFGGAYSGFDGADGDKAQKLDVQFYQLKLPTVTASMAFGGAIMAFCCLLVLLGVLRIPWRFPVWLLVESILDIVIAVGYIPALYFYFRYLQEAYNSQICKDRETLYTSKGYKGFSCALHGADIAAALFACMAIIAFCISTILAIKGFRKVCRMKKKPTCILEF
ncbi:MARVEL domain-containing protein 3 [Bombina bombina]|uniref:MARVEL domain-containing protein 3 n=1 Tax=Bombina bombina TaxID=8345 RepID=UPI00235AAC37|nr:MARVEL domain-containing protein 3 [Bombina bombina]